MKNFSHENFLKNYHSNRASGKKRQIEIENDNFLTRFQKQWIWKR